MSPFEQSHEATIRSYAKVNLGLYVTGKREDGYHTIETIVQKISLWDDIAISWKPCDMEKAVAGEKKHHGIDDEPINIVVKTDKPYLPVDERNLAYRAARLMIEEARAKKKELMAGKLRISIRKKIPVAAGLGGGSSNGAAVMVALNKIWGMGFNTRKLCEIAKKLGADVPFCVLVHNTDYVCGLGTGTGDDLNVLSKGLRCHMIVAKPAFGVSTKEVYEGIDSINLEEKRDSKDISINLEEKRDSKDIYRHKEEIETRNYSKIYEKMYNDLEEYTLIKYPEVQRLKEIISQTPQVKKVMMTGSGPTIVACFSSYNDARNACALVRKRGYEAYWCQTVR